MPTNSRRGRAGGGGNRLFAPAAMETTTISCNKLLYLLIIIITTSGAVTRTTTPLVVGVECNLSTPVDLVAVPRVSCQPQTLHDFHRPLSSSFAVVDSGWQPTTTTTTSKRRLNESALLFGEEEADFTPPVTVKETTRLTLGGENILLMRILDAANSNSVNRFCASEVLQLRKAFHRRETWALKVVDASGGYNPGFMLGNNHWLGSPTLCDYASPHSDSLRISYSARFNRHASPNLLTATAPFHVHYAVVYVRHQSPHQFEMKFMAESILHIGLCVPRSCSAADLTHLTAQLVDSLSVGKDMEEEGVLELERIFPLQRNAVVLGSKVIAQRNEFTQKIGYKSLKYFLLAIAIATIFGSCGRNKSRFSGGVERERGEMTRQSETENTSSRIRFSHRQSREQSVSTWKREIRVVLVKGGTRNCEESEKVMSSIEVQWHQILNCFSLTDNFRNIWSTSSSSSSSSSAAAIPTVDGVRVICCALIMCFHVPYEMFYTANNPTIFFGTAERLSVALIANAPLLVDIFFAISGFLHCYNFFRDAKTVEKIRRRSMAENWKLVGKMLLKRYIRLSIVHFLVILLGQVGGTYLWLKSPFWIFERNDVTCGKFWWRNVLYIHNLFHADELCVNWTWSVACEMQFYALFSVGFVAYVKRPQLTKKLFLWSTALIASFSLFLLVKFQFQGTFDVLFNTGTWLYISPWSRIHPYIAGTFLGWLVHPGNRDLVTWFANNEFVLGTLSKYLATGIIFGTMQFAAMKRNLFPWSCGLMFLIRCFFGGSAVWLIILSRVQQRKSGGSSCWLSHFLGCTFFHLSKLSYSIYLLHPLVIAWVFGLRTQSSRLELASYIPDTLGIMVITYIFSLLVTVLIETPLQRVVKLYLK